MLVFPPIPRVVTTIDSVVTSALSNMFTNLLSTITLVVNI